MMNRSIKGIFLYTVLLVVLFNLIFVFFSLVMIFSQMKKYVYKQNKILINSISIIIDNYYEEKINILNNLSKIITIRKNTPQSVSVNTLLDTYADSYDFFDGIMILDEYGTVVSASKILVSSVGFSYARSEFFTETKKSGKPFWSKSFVSNETSNRSLTVAFPMNEYIIVAYINLVVIEEKIADISKESSITASILDRNGVYIVTDKAFYAESYKVDVELLKELKINKSGVFERKSGKNKILVSYLYLENIHWTIIIDQEEEDVFFVVRQINYIQFGYLIVLLVMLFVMSNNLLVKFNKSLAGFVKSMDRLSSGEYSEGGALSGLYEFQQLYDYFNRMQMSIKSREEEIRQSEKKFRSLSENIPVGIGVAGLDGKLIYVNAKFVSLFGYDIGDVHTVTEWSLKAYPDEKYRIESELLWKSDIETAVSSGVMYSKGRIYKIVTKDGIVRDVEISFSLANNELYVVFNDLSDAIAMSRELVSTKNYLNKVINSMQSLIIAVDNKRNVVITNNFKLPGLPFEFENTNDLKHLTDYFTELEKKMNESCVTQEMVIIESLKKQEKGVFYYYDISIYPIENEGLVIVLDDITEKNRFREMLVQTEKMVTIGELAAGMAHEINNPLAAIIQGGQNMMRRLSSELPANLETCNELGISLEQINEYLKRRNILSYIDGINSSGKRAAYIVSNMLNFSRKSNAGKEDVSINEILDFTINLTCTDYDIEKKYDFKQINIVKNYSPDLPLISIKKTEIEQVFINLIKNAAFSMIEKATQSVTEYKPELQVSTFREIGSEIIIVIQDNGGGMTDSVRKRIFEPFFTTKPVGVGTGLGLTVTYFIITQTHKGSISVESLDGEWTKFTIKLPFET
ncbi:MAG: hypothetical protein A2015_06555 [Spirochaetes bacterium GWF1_31_7]|nr:MAG: hypothetical protein A2Y30_08390 [Spirochaetes bacterium GWE1_32_154]OHD51406.1 MAG: hypothetical protein A2Y29_14775 [Spirochaetes bacterium GWE2_31_10]OHD53132.1 MAG: hypothetical protein A2015_06555 [Spirochaetes bacterium GWF1_31_7]HBD94447.1 hypothetical protein [Spirochaetia bacterium]HBI36092.1 hypothetical protein [Spirochaetia bacterium]